MMWIGLFHQIKHSTTTLGPGLHHPLVRQTCTHYHRGDSFFVLKDKCFLDCAMWRSYIGWTILNNTWKTGCLELYSLCTYITRRLTPRHGGFKFCTGIASLQDIYCEDAVTRKRLSCFQDIHAAGFKANPNLRIASSKAAVMFTHPFLQLKKISPLYECRSFETWRHRHLGLDASQS